MRWVKSAYCAAGECVEVAWARSSFCQQGECAEVAGDGPDVLMRSSVTGRTIAMTRDAFTALLDGIKAGEFDDLAAIPAR